MGFNVCFFFDECSITDAEKGKAAEWYRIAENWQVDSLVMIDETRTAGRKWFEDLVPGDPYKVPVSRYLKIEEYLETDPFPFVYIERKDKRPSAFCTKPIGLYRYEHRPDATYVIGGHFGRGLEKMPVQGDWVYVPANGTSGFASHMASVVLYDRARKEAIASEVVGIHNKREKKLYDALTHAAQIQRSALKIMDKVLNK